MVAAWAPYIDSVAVTLLLAVFGWWALRYGGGR